MSTQIMNSTRVSAARELGCAMRFGSLAAHPKQLCGQAPHCHRQHDPGCARLCVRPLPQRFHTGQ
jgi:hypothetical protein